MSGSVDFVCQKLDFDQPRLAGDELDSRQGYDNEGRLCMSKERGLIKDNYLDLKKLAPNRQGNIGRNSQLFRAFSTCLATAVSICCR
jgi:hypothetical protein